MLGKCLGHSRKLMRNFLALLRVANLVAKFGSRTKILSLEIIQLMDQKLIR